MTEYKTKTRFANDKRFKWVVMVKDCITTDNKSYDLVSALARTNLYVGFKHKDKVISFDSFFDLLD